MSTLDHYNYVSRQVTQELDCRNVTTYSLQGVFHSLDFLYFFNWHLNTCGANYCKKLIWTLVNMHIHSHLVTSPEKNHILHPRFLPQKQSWLLASCRNLRKTKETAFLWFTQGTVAPWSLHKVTVSRLKGMQEPTPVGGKGLVTEELGCGIHALPRHVTSQVVSSYPSFCNTSETQNALAPILTRSARISTTELLSVITPEFN